jgi:hypothetical protein
MAVTPWSAALCFSWRWCEEGGALVAHSRVGQDQACARARLTYFGVQVKFHCYWKHEQVFAADCYRIVGNLNRRRRELEYVIAKIRL